MTKPRVAVALPTCNEGLTIAETIAAFRRVHPEATVHVINNNSNDKTGELAQAALAGLGTAGSVIDEPRQGKGNALRRAFHVIEADVYLLAEADLTYPVDRAQDMNRADPRRAGRYGGGRPAFWRPLRP
jgi:glycosyltransferase involved in cell wall biosynthesis